MHRSSALKAAIDNLKSIGIATIAASGDNVNIGFHVLPRLHLECRQRGRGVGHELEQLQLPELPWKQQPTAADKILCTSNIAPYMSLLAPGAPIRSSLPGSASPASINNYGARGGTAMAAAQVAGAWAVLKQKAPEASVDSILGVLKSTGVPITSAVGTFPRIDIPRALEEIEKKKIVYTREGTGTGRVTFTAGAQACDLSCERTFLNGGEVTLTAAASPGSVFAGWSERLRRHEPHLHGAGEQCDFGHCHLQHPVGDLPAHHQQDRQWPGAVQRRRLPAQLHRQRAR